MRKAIGSIVIVLLLVLMTAFGSRGVLFVDGGGDYSDTEQSKPIFTVDGGGDRSEPDQSRPVFVVDGGGDYSEESPSELNGMNV